jgi:hypothetical protein
MNDKGKRLLRLWMETSNMTDLGLMNDYDRRRFICFVQYTSRGSLRNILKELRKAINEKFSGNDFEEFRNRLYGKAEGLIYFYHESRVKVLPESLYSDEVLMGLI